MATVLAGASSSREGEISGMGGLWAKAIVGWSVWNITLRDGFLRRGHFNQLISDLSRWISKIKQRLA
jgi:hypothetical protein